MSASSSGPIKLTLRTIFQYAANSCRIAIFMGAGDIIMQHYSNSKDDTKKNIDWQRAAKFATIGLCFMGPIVTYWKYIVNSIISENQHHTSRIIQQLYCDQIYLAPCMNLGLITMFGIICNESDENIEKRISEYFPYILKRHYMLWPGVQFLGSIAIQPSLQQSFANVIAIFWYAYLSGILHRDKVLELSPRDK